MSRVFDYNSESNVLRGAVGANWYLGLPFEPERVNGGLAGSALSMLSLAVSSILVGSNETVTPLLDKARHWVTAAINGNERPGDYFPTFHEAERYRTLFLCNWLLEGAQDEASLRALLEFRRKYYIANPQFNKMRSFSYSAVEFLDGAAYGDFLDLIARSGNVPVPNSVSQAKVEATVAAAYSVNKLERRFLEADLEKALRRVLDRYMNEWLTTRRQPHAIHWLKFVYWRRGTSSLTPKDVVLKAYDHMPKSPKPPLLKL